MAFTWIGLTEKEGIFIFDLIFSTEIKITQWLFYNPSLEKKYLEKVANSMNSSIHVTKQPHIL